MPLNKETIDMSTQNSGSAVSSAVKRVTKKTLFNKKKRGEKFSCLTAYDAMTARLFDEAGIDLLLVGDSVANVVQGHETTIPVTLDEIIYHTRAVVRGASRSMIVADMPFMSYQVSVKEAFTNAGRLMKEGRAGAVKLEGGERVAESVQRMTEAGIPVMGHLGLTPQSINEFGSYRARGKDPEEAQQLKQDALILQQAGAFAVVLEKIPMELAKEVSASLEIPTIGIGAGPHCDGQILVYSDMLGITQDFNPRFVRKYLDLNTVMKSAVQHYIRDIAEGTFPSEDESY